MKAMKAKEKIYENLVKSGINHPQIWKGFSAFTQENGWHMREFGTSEDVYLGKNLKEALED